MILTERIHKAINRAAVLHNGQVRRGSEQVPYITHLFSVAILLDAYGADEDTIVAGIFHDSLEDVAGYTYDDLLYDIGAPSAALVQEVTEPHADKTLHYIEDWQRRKESYLTVLRSGTRGARMVAAADKIHNIESLIYGAHENKEGFFAHFTEEAAARTMWFFDNVGELFTGYIPVSMYEHFTRVKEELRSLYRERYI